jgi:hypothetical protein
MAIYAGFRFDWFAIDTSFGTISPQYRNDVEMRIQELAIGTMVDGTSYAALLNNEGISILYPSGLELAKIPEAAGATALAAYGDTVIWAINGTDGPKLGIFSVSSETRQNIFVNASASDEIESGLIDAEIFVDPVNGTITEISADGTSIAVVVDVGQIRRVVLVDRVVGNSAIISEPAWDAWSPHMTDDRIVFTQITAFDPNNQDTDSNLNDVYLYDRSEKILISLTSGSEAFHEDPRIVSIGAAWLVTDEDGNTILEVYNLEDPFEPYSSILLQAAVVILAPLLMVWTVQAASESKHSQDSASSNI